MENKREIGKLFKDKLDYLDKSPSDNLWASIESDLNKKRKRRILFWLIPSLLMVGVAGSILFTKLNPDQTKPVSTQQSKTEIKLAKSAKQQSSDFKNKQSKDVINKSILLSQPNPQKTIGSSSETKTTIKKTRTEKLIKQSSKLVATTDEYEEYEVVKKYKVIIRKNKTVTTNSKRPGSVLKKSNSTSPKKISKNKIKKTKKGKANNSKKQIPSNVYESKKLIEKGELDEINSKKNVPKSSENSKSIDSLNTIKKDSIPQNQEKKNTPKREYIRKEYPEQVSENEPEYSVSIYYGPAIFGSLSNNSTINESLNDVSKSHPITSHYGFYFKSMYGKYGFKAGISKINLKIANHLNSQSTVNYDNMTLRNTDIYSVMANDEDIRLVQKISYYEIPLEFNYAIKKDDTPYGVEAFTGFSVLFSDANQLFLSSNNLKNEEIGSTKNLNKMNLSFNLGLGFNYKLTEKFQLDFNPIFKYYLTTFKNDKEPKPYSLSIQSGVTYKF